jgi:hypothetical protein
MPLLSPTTFFLLVINGVYAFFDTFGIIHAVTARRAPAAPPASWSTRSIADAFVDAGPRRLGGPVDRADGDRRQSSPSSSSASVERKVHYA